MTTVRTNRPFGGKHGFSLVELLVATVIFSLLSVAVVSSTLLFSRLVRNISDQQDFDASIKMGMTTLGNDARMADRFDVFSKTDIRIHRSDGSFVDYSLEKQNDGTHSLIRSDDDGERVIARNISSLMFSADGQENRKITLEMELNKPVAGSKDSQRSLDISFARRN